MPARKKMFLVDGSNQAFRAFFAIQTDMRGQDDFPTRALYGFNSMVDKLLRDHKPDYLCVLFDKGLSFRNDLYPDYKGQRPDMPEDLRKQWPEFIPFCKERGIAALAMEGFEADDIIGTLARRHAGEALEVFIVSSDKDFAQLVTDNVKLFDIAKGNLYGPAEVTEKWGVEPERIIDLLALMGDSSDNIPGARGVGPKTAVKYLSKWPTARAVVDAAVNGEIKGKTGEKVAAHADQVDLSFTLATIKTDIPQDVLSLSLADLEIGDEDLVALEARLKRYNFRRYLRRVQESLGDKASTRVSIDRDAYTVVRTPAALQALVRDLYAVGRVSVDLETTSLNPRQAEIVGISFCTDAATAVYVPVAHEDGDNCPGALSTLAPLLADPNLEKVGQNLKYDLKVLRARGYDLQGITDDTMLAHYLLRVDQRHGLDDQALTRLDHKMLSYKETTESVGGLFARLSVDTAAAYAAEDAHVAFLLDKENAFAPEVERVYREIEIPLVDILARMELRGIGVDVAALKDISAELAVRLKELTAAIHEEAGEVFTINSPKQLSRLLFEKRGLTPVKKTKTGYSTNAEVLEFLANAGDRLSALVLEYRQLDKLRSTYLDALPGHVEDDGRIHTSFHQAVAATGRLSSNEPNLQNIPIRTAEGRRIRQCFKPAPGFRFLSADYSQVELRVLAHFAGDGPLVECFASGEDIHRRTASEIFGVHINLVSGEQRRAAKTINFGIVYGMSAFRLANQLGISRTVAQKYIDDYFARMPQVLSFIESAKDSAREKGYAETLFGRRRPVRNLDTKNFNERAAAERIAVNTPVQGTAADLIKMAMIRVDQRLGRDFPRARLLLQVHDELVLEVPEDEVEAVRAAVKEEMEGVADLRVPLRVDTGVGDNWDEAH